MSWQDRPVWKGHTANEIRGFVCLPIWFDLQQRAEDIRLACVTPCDEYTAFQRALRDWQEEMSRNQVVELNPFGFQRQMARFYRGDLC